MRKILVPIRFTRYGRRLPHPNHSSLPPTHFRARTQENLTFARLVILAPNAD
jgi:hypothetical protein